MKINTRPYFGMDMHFLSASSSLALLARASSTSADVTEVDDDDDGIPQLSFAMSSDGVP